MHRVHLLGILLTVVSGLVPMEGWAQDPTWGAPTTDTVTLTLQAAERLALVRNPILSAARREEGISLGERRQAGVYRFNPEVEFEAERLDAPGGQRALDRYEAQVVQEVEWAGQWGLRKDAADHGLRGARASVRDAERRTLLDVREGFHQAAAAQRKLEVAEEIAELSRRLRDAVATQLAEGDVSALEANLARIEHGRARSRVQTARRTLTSALLSLKRVVGLDPETGVVLAPADPGGTGNAAPVPGLPDPALLEVDSLTREALARRPDLRAAEAAADEARTRERLARREAIPNLRLLVPIRRTGPGADPDIGFGLGLSVPLWNRNQGTADARKATLSRTEDLRSGVSLRVRTEVRDALQAYRSATEEARELETSVLAPARENRTLLEEAYRAGKIGLPSLLLLRNQLLDAELAYWDAWLARRQAWARLRAALGDPPSAPGETP